MRLSLVCLFDKLPGGNIFRGKHKLEPKIRYWMRRELVKDIQREERNMLILRNHYLSKAQVAGYRHELGKETAFYKRCVEFDRRNWPKNRHLEEAYGHLRHMDCWD